MTGPVAHARDLFRRLLGRQPGVRPQGSGVDRVIRAPDPDIKRLPHEPNRWPAGLHLSVGYRKRYRRQDNGVVVTKAQEHGPKEYANGCDLDASGGRPTTCTAALPYYPGQLGAFEIRCTYCGLSLEVPSVGRPDDPRLVRVPCRWGGSL